MSGRAILGGMAAATAIIAVACLVLVAPTGQTSDSDCGAIIDRNFEWANGGQQCGIAYSGMAAAIATLSVVALALAIAAWRRPRSPHRVVWALTVVAATTCGAFLTLCWFVSAYPEPVLRRGWTSVRNLAGYVTLYLGLLAAVAAFVQPLRVGGEDLRRGE